MRWLAGKGVYALRRTMLKSLLTYGTLARVRNALARGLRSIRRFIFSRAFAGLLVGISSRVLCVAAGLGGVLGGSLCAISAACASSLFRTFFAVAPFDAHPPIPLSLGAFLATDFERHLDITTIMLGAPLDQAPQSPRPADSADSKEGTL